MLSPTQIGRCLAGHSSATTGSTYRRRTSHGTRAGYLCQRFHRAQLVEHNAASGGRVALRIIGSWVTLDAHPSSVGSLQKILKNTDARYAQADLVPPTSPPLSSSTILAEQSPHLIYRTFSTPMSSRSVSRSAGYAESPGTSGHWCASTPPSHSSASRPRSNRTWRLTTDTRELHREWVRGIRGHQEHSRATFHQRDSSASGSARGLAASDLGPSQ